MYYYYNYNQTYTNILLAYIHTGAGYCTNYPHDVKPTPGYWIECRGGANLMNVTEIRPSGDGSFSNPYGECAENGVGEDGEITTHLLTTGELTTGRSHHRHNHPKPPPTPTVEAVLTRGRLTRQETIKSNQDDIKDGGDNYTAGGRGNGFGVCVGSGGEADDKPVSKDDLELIRKPSITAQQTFPNITITIVQPNSPPSSPPIAGKLAQQHQSDDNNNNYNTNINNITTQFQSHQIYQSSVISSGRRASISSLCSNTTSFLENNKNSSKVQSIQRDKANQSDLDSQQQQGDLNSTTKHIKSDNPFELISFEEEIFEKYFYGREHWNYFTNDEALGPVIMSLKQETIGGRDQFRVLLRTMSYSLHGLVPTSAICADRYDREAVVRCLGDEANLKPQLRLGQLPSTPDELLKLDQVFVKSELKVGLIYVQSHQVNSEEAILGNRYESSLFVEFMSIIGDRIRLKGFDKYKGGLDTGK